MAERRYLPWLPVTVIDHGQPATHLELRKSDVAALQAVNAGIANEGQQKQAIAAILHMAAVNDLEFLPDEHGGDRGSTFKGGMRHVGLQLRKLLTHSLDLLAGDPDGGRSQHDRRTGKPADQRNADRSKQ
ncbi:hypothetical protein CYG48_05010 [Neorhizobium sp. SOG26]|nr:hypothetical protein CYG48_05010 [Neorhizobium sp. SOG26]